MNLPVGLQAEFTTTLATAVAADGSVAPDGLSQTNQTIRCKRQALKAMAVKRLQTLASTPTLAAAIELLALLVIVAFEDLP